MTSTDAVALNKAVLSAEAVASSSIPHQMAKESFSNVLKEQGLTGEEFLPSTGETEKLGFANRKKDLWEIYLAVVREKLCTKDGKLRKHVGSGLQGTATVLVSLIVIELSLPVIAYGIASAIAGFMLATGVETFCRWQK